MKPPTRKDPDRITHTIVKRITRYLEKAGYLVRDADAAYLDLAPEPDDAMSGIIGASVTYRLAVGPRAGQKALTLQMLPANDQETKTDELVSHQGGFSLHAGVACKSMGPPRPAERTRALVPLHHPTGDRGERGPPSDCRWPATVM